MIELKELNDEKLHKAKKKIEGLKTKNGRQLMIELGIIKPDDKYKDTSQYIQNSKDKVLRGRFSLPKMSSKYDRYQRNSQIRVDISTVQEDELEESNSNNSVDQSVPSVSCEESVSIQNETLMLTKDNLNKFSLK